ncbi:MAG: winged helix-turn-helix domain-containing protein [Nocardioides sp.]
MTESSPDQASSASRKGFLLHEVLRILAEEGTHVPRSQVLGILESRLDFTPYEAERTGVHKRPRWVAQVTWGSVVLRTAGMIDKHRDGWIITAAGREAIARFPPGAGLDSETNRLSPCPGAVVRLRPQSRALVLLTGYQTPQAVRRVGHSRLRA